MHFTSTSEKVCKIKICNFSMYVMKVPSPCIDVCKYKYKNHCIGCSMTKIQKKTFKKLSTMNQKKDFLNFIINQQTFLGRFKHWEKVYEKKCIKKGLTLKNLLSDVGVK